MLGTEHIMISLEPRHADNILSGTKKVELRRRSMSVSTGATVWLYATHPIGSLVGKVRIADVHAASPKSLWRQFGEASQITRAEFFDYFEGVSCGFALELKGAQRLRRSINLAELRNASTHFHPPQFFMRLPAGNPVLSTLLSVQA
jgi:predicted transcriptional regulator